MGTDTTKSATVFNRSSRPEVYCKQSVFKHFAKLTRKYPCRSLFLKKLQAGGLQLYLKETLEHVFSYEFFKNLGTPIS